MASQDEIAEEQLRVMCQQRAIEVEESERRQRERVQGSGWSDLSDASDLCDLSDPFKSLLITDY